MKAQQSSLSLIVPRILIATLIFFYGSAGMAYSKEPTSPPAQGDTMLGNITTDTSAFSEIDPNQTKNFSAEAASGISLSLDPRSEGKHEIDSDTIETEKGYPLPPTALPHKLSPWGMFMDADIVVKTVMIGLAIASLLTWTIWVAKTIELLAARHNEKRNLVNVSAAYTLADAANSDAITGITRDLVEAAELELRLSADILKAHENDESTKEAIKAGIKERVKSRLSRIESSSTRGLMLGTGLLATVGSTSPFVGLFGTVWGIMNSFIGISEAHTTNLSIVAPGIAEALLATALGLAAAIPAVVIYNQFSRRIMTVKSLVSDSSSVITRLLSRDLDRGNQLRVVDGHSTFSSGE